MSTVTPLTLLPNIYHITLSFWYISKI